MKKIMLTYGVLSGVVIIVSMILSLRLAGESTTMKGLEWLGYLIMVVALSMIFVGIKRYRDQELGGVIKFGTAFRLGLGISLVAGVIYVVAWEANLLMTDYAFIDDYARLVLADKEAAGVTGAEMEAAVTEMEQLKVRYANPLFRLPMTFLEIFPAGLLITLIAAAVLRNSRFMPAVQPVDSSQAVA